ncbi:DEAD/DEAH box helicase family protein [Picrophilus oshimae]|uniref:DNA repair helicase n=1 Tax=Picrophilus torridus (strain ATCC 700027 / DSM 9790 / JCM 10055 / NBRC 100828 / KAW 2/3) TaxID=1122961 RepID=Q6KZE5_PICTO|nr:DEAD/DEAH box helicase family protein [Picrophilus oshimae]AAT43907.1 DNA repair helicase [Picrophilus oshimae DSM 9789]SMD31022.1 DNA repair helicase RAD25 [Picrophilus oshimae DSM 9789]
MRIYYDAGTIVSDENTDPFLYDKRSGLYRAPAYLYNVIKKRYPDAIDDVINHKSLDINADINLRPYQIKSIEMWAKNDYNGVIVLPTAAGKTMIGIYAINMLKTTTLVIAPTIELVQQWRDKLKRFFGIEIGQIGGGEKDIKDITVITYDSAYLMAESLGNMFELLIADEVHHMAAESYIQIAKMYASRYRLGLTATYERPDKNHELLENYMGGKIFELGYEQLNDYISNFKIFRIPVELDDDMEIEYERNRKIFLDYIHNHDIKINGNMDFEHFILSSWNPEGREALMAWRRSREIAYNPKGKIEYLRYILSKHPGKKTIIFSEDTNTAYMISREFLVPALTYLTPPKERKRYLEMFRDGRITVLATSRILDEGVDVPDASIAVIMSGSGSTRQFRQRLGRILRPAPGKESILYELVSSNTYEYGTSRRRRKGVPIGLDDSA